MAGDRTAGRDYREVTVQDQGTYVEGNYYSTPEQRQNLAAAAAEIQQLLERFDQTYATDTVAGQMKAAQATMEQIESSTPLADRVLSALRAGGMAALKQTLKHPAATFVFALLDDWQKTKEQ